MYTNIGGKIKGLAIFLFIAGTISCFVFGLMLFEQGSEGIIVFLIIVAGAVFSWLSSLVMYGFGELVEKVTLLADGAKSTQPKLEPTYMTVPELEKIVEAQLVDEHEFESLLKRVSVESREDEIKINELRKVLKGNVGE